MIALLVGTRPEIIKMAPVMRELKRRQLEFLFIHSNQHYSQEMDKLILSDLRLNEPDFHLRVGSASHAIQTGRIMAGVEKICLAEKPTMMLVHGDTNTTLAGALASKKIHIPVAHVEAGLRSRDYQMPEEINRTLVDRLSDLLFAPTIVSKRNLLSEGFSSQQIIVTGNTVVDAVAQHLPLINKSLFKNYALKQNKYILLTAHRPENVDNKSNLELLLELITRLQARLKLPMMWPVHPRTQSSLDKHKITTPKLDHFLKLVPPVGYLDMLSLLKNASLVVTDSGGIQEEAYILKKPLITIRTSTERPETMSANFIVGLDINKLNHALTQIKLNKLNWDDALGDGQAAPRIVKSIHRYLCKS